MIAMNIKMSESYKNLSLADIKLDSELFAVATSGFICKKGCFFIAKCLPLATSVSISNFPDKTGYECFVNSINIDCYVDGKYLEQGILFVLAVFRKWREQQKKKKLVAIFSLSKFGLKIKCHLERTGEQWQADDLEGYEEEAVLVVDSSESEFIGKPARSVG